MKSWRTRTLAIVALLALLPSGLPALMWACPASGRIGDANWVCQNMPRHCAHPGSDCCHPARLPASDTAPGPNNNIAVLTRTAVQAVEPNGQAAPEPIALPDPPQQIRPRLAFVPRTAHSFYLCSQHGPPPSAGRSPPVLAS